MVLRARSAEESVTVQATRFKGEILKLVPGLCEVKDGKYVLLTLDSEIGLYLKLVKVLSMMMN